MDKTAIKNFAMWARVQLIQDVSTKAAYYGITDKGYTRVTKVGDVLLLQNSSDKAVILSASEARTRENFIAKVEATSANSSYCLAYQSLVEEIAYTWFNRIIAIRFMEANGYLPSRVKVLSSDVVGKSEPDIVTHPEDAELNLSAADNDYIYEQKINNKQAELFKFLFIKQCNALNAYLPELFEKFDDYTEMFIDLNYADKDSVVRKVVSDINEQDFKDAVEIIGWMYQYYNTVPKQNVFDALKKNIKIGKESIPAATQLFTPDWIVRYMIDNSLGKKYIDYLKTCKKTSQSINVNDYDLQIAALRKKWKYFIDSEEFETIETFDIANLTVIDPCMGSGHILVYAFEVLVDIYKNMGYAERDIPSLILQNNLFGLDIDKRAYQLSYFAVMMMARKYDRTFLKAKKVNELHLSDFIESNDLQNVGDELLKMKTVKFLPAQADLADYLVRIFTDGMTYGSALIVEPADYQGLSSVLEVALASPAKDIVESGIISNMFPRLIKMCKLAKLLSDKYAVVCTNPPYMGSNGMDDKLSTFVKDNYPNSKSDLCTMFIEHGFDFIKVNGYNAMVTMQSWMFLSSFEKMRANLLKDNHIVTMVHMDNMVMGIAFGTCATVWQNGYNKAYLGQYSYVEMKDLIKDEKDNMLPKTFPIINERYKKCNSANFNKIPGSPIAYWVSDKIINLFDCSCVDDISETRQGMIPGNTEEFLRLWYEVNNNKIGKNHCENTDILKYKMKWFPYNKGGSYRRWYGNIEHLIDMENDGNNIKFSGKNNNFRLREPKLYFQEALTWSKISSGAFSMRFMPKGCLFDIAGCCIFFLGKKKNYVLGFTNSKIADVILKFISPTLNYEVDHVKKLPIIMDEEKKPQIDSIVEENIAISKTDWDSFETSWDFTKHPLI
ncbi:MAG: BREX-1 system adenine-specific DNA-methyltransferase PglX [Christensenellaceae bacterium]